MSMIIGIGMVVALFGAPLIISIFNDWWEEALWAYGVTAGIIMWIAGAVYLISGGNW